MPVRTWIRDHTAEGRIAHRVEGLLGGPSSDDNGVESAGDYRTARVARLEQPGRWAGPGSRLSARLGEHLDPGRRAAAAVGIAALIAVLIAGTWLLVNRPHSVVVDAGSSLPSAATSASSSRASPSASAVGSPKASTSTIVVDVVGKVANPGIYRLPTGSRVDDALRAAGGVLPGVDLAALNRAQVVSDGQQIAVAVPGAPAAAAGAGPGSGGSTGPVNLNTATAAQLDILPGVGPVLAQHIIAWRAQHGRFSSIDQLREVSGIGDAKFDDLRALVTV